MVDATNAVEGQRCAIQDRISLFQLIRELPLPLPPLVSFIFSFLVGARSFRAMHVYVCVSALLLSLAKR